jgi:hypothetical protein
MLIYSVRWQFDYQPCGVMYAIKEDTIHGIGKLEFT